MTKTIITLLICIGSIGITFGQISINGRIYSDSTLTKPLSKVKLILKSNNGKNIYRTDEDGKFKILTKIEHREFVLEVKKRGYTSVRMEGISKDITFDVILRKALSVHDKGYEGASEVIMQN